MDRQRVEKSIRTDLLIADSLTHFFSLCHRGFWLLLFPGALLSFWNACVYGCVIRSLAEHIVDRYPKEIESSLKRLQHHDHISQQLEAAAPGNDDYYSSEWWDRQLPCALLKDNLCSVYEARPVPCRNYFVASDPARCDTREKQKVAMVLPVNPHTQGQILFNLQPASGHVVGWFPEMLLHAWKQRK